MSGISWWFMLIFFATHVPPPSYFPWNPAGFAEQDRVLTAQKPYATREACEADANGQLAKLAPEAKKYDVGVVCVQGMMRYGIGP